MQVKREEDAVRPSKGERSRFNGLTDIEKGEYGHDSTEIWIRQCGLAAKD